MADNNVEIAPPSTDNRCAFFYGTLMAPKVLHRVCHGSMAEDNPIYKSHNLKTYPAILHDHRRHKVKQADYPAIVPHKDSTVRGTLVTGLTEADIWRLDIFEGDEYTRQKINCRILTTVGDETTGEGNIEGEEFPAETYIWNPTLTPLLENSEWDFTEFQREKLKFWIGDEAQGEYAEVDEAVAAAAAAAAADEKQRHDGTRGRGSNGHITNALNEASRNGV